MSAVLYLEVPGSVQSGNAAIEDDPLDDEVRRRRDMFAQLYAALPTYASHAFWQAMEAPDVPLEVLTRILRHCPGSQDRNRVLHIIFQRTQQANEYWARQILRHIPVPADERFSLMCDLCADLYECMIRALLNPARHFWEENFLHCLSFERKHVYCAFMRREGRWHDAQVKRSERIPRVLLARLDQRFQEDDSVTGPLDIEDERAQFMLHAVEQSDVVEFVLCLPESLKTLILLIFWEGRSEKDVAHLLGISSRTVRNRLREALKQLRARFPLEEV